MTSTDKEVVNENDVYDKMVDKVQDLAALPLAVCGAAAVGIPTDLISKEGGGMNKLLRKDNKYSVSNTFSSSRPVNRANDAKEVDYKSLGSAATIIQAWLRGYLDRRKKDALKTRKSLRQEKTSSVNSGKQTAKTNKTSSVNSGRRIFKSTWHHSQQAKHRSGILERVNIPSWPAPPIPSSTSVILRTSDRDKDGDQGRKAWRRHYIHFLPENDPNLGIVMFLDSFYSRQKNILGLRIVDTPPPFAQEIKHIKELQHETLPMIVSFGGMDPKDPEHLNVGRTVMRYHVLKDRWEYYGLMPETRSHHSSVYLNGIIYIIGGYDPNLRDGGEMIATKSVFGLDVKSGRWKRYKDMNSARAHHGVAVVNGEIICIGGRDHRGRIVASVEIYDPVKGSWRVGVPLEEGRMGMAMTTCEGTLWMMGGTTTRSDDPHEHYILSTVESFDPSLQTWTSRPSLRVPRAYASAITDTKNRVWIVGGCSGGYQKKNYLESMNALDCYSTEKGEWAVKSFIVNARHCAAVVAVDDCVYLIGGMSSQEWTPLCRTEVYMVDSDRVYLPAEIPIPLTGIAALCLPPCVPTYRSQSLSDMIADKIGCPVSFMNNIRTIYGVNKQGGVFH